MKFSRSTFLKAGVLTAAALLGTRKGEIRAQGTSSGKRVIILGGGLAGLYSAYLLGKTGSKVTLIEATDRVGGRVRSVTDPSGNVVDLGGEWVSSEDKTVRSLVRELGLKLQSAPLQPDLFLGTYKKAGAWDMSPEAQDTLSKLVAQNSKLNTTQQQELDRISIYNYLLYQGISAEDLVLLNHKLSLHYGDGIRVLSAEKVLGDLAQFPKRNSRLEGGMENLAKTLVLNIENTEFVFSDPVLSVDQDANGVTVSTASGRKFTGSNCICTLPVNQISKVKWNPGLDKEKLLAALRVRYSQIFKTFLVLKEAPWDSTPFSVHSDAAAQFLYDAGTKSDGSDKVLGIIASGDRFSVFDSANQDQKVEYIRLTLSRLGLKNDLQIQKIYFTESKGEYVPNGIAIFPPGSFGSEIILRKPFDRILFAGEHTGEITGTIEAALSSAIRAVNLV
ncbi:FAD-binding protein [Leptospira langatensis]|uniref:FAD-binding protein n=1 Tax=Leptospira langatensis TaxID=2484983 RepID=A0A5F1ZUR7_9LEPT|nr:FAD-dependent oxidoreductase [Leptospira langatensis]TGK01528.1 FAD-binding protein [Leptospira langatensis]TGL42022.1 FAD-binding protein [Leptospira langatensis]